MVITNPDLFGLSMDEMIDRVSAVPFYRDGFEEAFPSSGITADNVLDCIATFEEGIVARRSPFDQHLAGAPKALTDSAKRGLALFVGKANCFVCHNGPLLSDGKFHNTGVVTDDVGRIAVVRNQDIFRMRPYPFFANHKAFKTPGLRNVGQSAPYFHNGSVSTLEEVIKFYDRGGISPDRYGRSPDIFRLGLSDIERADILAFLMSLTSPIEYCGPAQVATDDGKVSAFLRN